MVDGRGIGPEAGPRGHARRALCRGLPPMAAALAALLLAPVAGTAAGGPTGAIQRLIADANRVLVDSPRESTPAERLDAVLRVVGPAFSFRDGAEAALGADWSARTGREQEEFGGLFTALLVRAVVVGVAGRARLADDGVVVDYLGETVAGSAAMVRTALVSRDGGQASVDYRLAWRDDRWVIHDVAIEGVSLVGTYRAQVARVLQTSSYGDLLARIRAKHLPEVVTGGRTVVAAAGTPTISMAVPDTPSIDLTSGSPGEKPGRSVAPAFPASVPAAGTGEPRPSSDPGPAARDPEATVLRQPMRDAASQPGGPQDGPALVGVVGRASTAAPASPGATPAPPPLRVRYWVQVSAFSRVDTALRLATTLLEQNYAVSMEPGHVGPRGGEPLTRVRVGPFADRAAASAMLDRLRRRGYAPFLAVDRP